MDEDVDRREINLEEEYLKTLALTSRWRSICGS